MKILRGSIRLGLFLLLLLLVPLCRAEDGITILYDAFGRASDLQKDWGFSALIEYQGKRILFDTGDNAEIFAHNVNALNVNLADLDFAVISHRHSDHISGIPYLLKMNPKLKIYALVEKTTEVAPGIFLIALVSNNTGTLELRELSLAIKTNHGLVLVVGCSHPGIENILEAAASINPHIHLIVGGMHLVTTPDAEVKRISLVLKERWKVDRIAPGHCTGEPAFGILAKDFGDRYLYAGLGTVLPLGDEVAMSGQGLLPEDLATYRRLLAAEMVEEEQRVVQLRTAILQQAPQPE